MPVWSTVGPPLLSINQGSTFMVTDLNGYLASDTDQGIFAGDTRFVGYYEIFASGAPWARLTSPCRRHTCPTSAKLLGRQAPDK